MVKGLLILLFCCSCTWLRGQLTWQTLQEDLDSVRTYKNLTIIPIRHKASGKAGPLRPELPLLSLSKALEEGKAVVSERGSAATENVHWLRINNKSGQPLFIASGEVIMGGRQDRMVTLDTVLMPAGEKDQYVPVMCVEEGRWSDKVKKFVYSNYANPRLRKVLDQSKNQVAVWREIIAQLDGSGIHSNTLAYTAQRFNKKFHAQQEDYWKFFREKLHDKDSSVVGMVCLSGDRIIGCDIFDNPQLFGSELDALLHGYIEEALTIGKPSTVKDEAVKKYLDKMLTDEMSQAIYLKKNGKIYKYNGKVFHITGYGEGN